MGKRNNESFWRQIESFSERYFKKYDGVSEKIIFLEVQIEFPIQSKIIVYFFKLSQRIESFLWKNVWLRKFTTNDWECLWKSDNNSSCETILFLTVKINIEDLPSNINHKWPFDIVPLK